MATINPNKLSAELISAGIDIGGCNTQGIVWDKSNNEIQDQPNVAAIIAAHNPVEYFLQPGMQVIIANGTHEAIVTCGINWYYGDMPTTDIILINGVEHTIQLENAQCNIVLTSDIPGTVIKLEYHGLYAVVLAE